MAEVEARNSVLTHKPTGRTLRFGEVAAAAAEIQLQAEPAVKPQSEWTLLGKTSPPKLNNPLIANGSAVFGIDVRLPGMLYAALMQAPVHGGKLKSYNFEAIKDMPGVRGVAVVRTTTGRPARRWRPCPSSGTTGRVLSGRALSRSIRRCSRGWSAPATKSTGTRAIR